MAHKDDKFEISCNDVLLLRQRSGKKIEYTFTFKPDEKEINSTNIYSGHNIQNQKIDILVLINRKGNLCKFISAINGKKIYAIKDNHNGITFFGPNKYLVNTCRLTTPINENGWFGSKKNFLGTFKNYLNTLFLVYNTPNVMNGYEILQPEEEKIIDKLLTSQHITANDILQAKEIITNYNAETARRYNLLLKNVSMLENKEKMAKKQKVKTEKLERKKQLKIDHQKSKIIANCIEKIAEK